jgi:hypothetical protein
VLVFPPPSAESLQHCGEWQHTQGSPGDIPDRASYREPTRRFGHSMPCCQRQDVSAAPRNRQYVHPLSGGMLMDEVLESYDRAWNELDDHERRRLLETARTDSAELVDPEEGSKDATRSTSGSPDSVIVSRVPGSSPVVSTSTTVSLGMNGRSSNPTEQ